MRQLGWCGAVAAMVLVAVISSGCASSKDMVKTRQVTASAYSTPQYQINAPSISAEDTVFVVKGTAHRIAPATQPSTSATPAQGNQYVCLAVMDPSGRLWQVFLLALAPVGDGSDTLEYHLRYYELPPAGSQIVAGMLDDESKMIGAPVRGSAAGVGTGGPGMVGYGAAGGAVYYNNAPVPSLSQQSFYNQTTGASRALGRGAPGYTGR